MPSRRPKSSTLCWSIARAESSSSTLAGLAASPRVVAGFTRQRFCWRLSICTG
ncbi:unnamed protein product [Polarella glacialis]|uniref:Uncharacterized protein n=1 Tax=Polarella glacialis TaxID=89957 RepID=A0A813HMT4_POLGL|nr:unnamed protein product [Polarella glacialis]